MTEMVASPTHHRLLSAFRAIGPYLRDPDSVEGSYLFDCLSVCVDDKKSPEEREFWGWWMMLESSSSAFKAVFKRGLYNQEGDWVEEPVPDTAVAEVERTREEFVKKLSKVLHDRFSLEFVVEAG
ncbi:sigma factor-binding protein Crl [Vibrio sp. JC009]|uniref:sigma factor-binding protein Crl n=1 Tax=Vibrio sp. JC009 TaxID=2912314 RepID=UPI0023AF32D0|nr:sigma factor-binding protein Crl [Vibrio sp. JC009]WED21292.1 sigma factor-binding protein Crl [Vibrio sp. JC009]